VVPRRSCYFYPWFVPFSPNGAGMPRKPSAIVQYKLRIRETLRRRIEQEAKKHGVSANQEMVSRLERSFEFERVRDLDDVAASMSEQAMSLAYQVDKLQRFIYERLISSRAAGAKDGAGDD
jgi:hypothetical protein